VLTSLALFVVVYGIIFGAGVYYMGKLVEHGPDETPEEPGKGDTDTSHRPMAAAGKP
jgi:cytochrome d ubiquinol oxidase subunit I